MTAYVGYADDLRSSPFFPMPWQGDPNVIFLGGGSPVDAGAFRLDFGLAQPPVVSVSVEEPATA